VTGAAAAPALGGFPPSAAIATAIFLLTYLVLGLGALPPLRLDRAGATLVGATLMVACGVVSPAQAAGAIDIGTLALLFGMMVVAANLRIAGFFGWTVARVLGVTRSPRLLLVLTTWLSGVLSALVVNDTVCVLLTPLVLELAAHAGLSPVPFLLALAMGANAGSVATVVGNPQNMMIASTGGISYASFAAALVPVALGALAITSAVLVLACGRALPATITTASEPSQPRVHGPLLMKTVAVTLGLVVAMLLGVQPPLAAMAAASVLLVTRRVHPGKVHQLVDWPLLAMFAGLFVVVDGVERSGIAAWLIDRLSGVLGGAQGFVALTAALSNLVSNVPAVMLLGKAAAAAPDPERARLLLAMASTLAGNLTLVGSVANLIVVSQAEPRARVGFWEYARVGAPITLLTLAWGAWWLQR
jgi:Na+/H+ antiporter NhaD/arsenite permease-like protein